MGLTRVILQDDDGTGLTGDILNNAWLQAVYDSLANWSTDSYAPTWGNTGTANVIGNGTLTGTYMERGKLVNFVISLVFGSSTTVGSGTQTFTLPVTLATLGQIGCQYTDAGTATYLGIAANTSSTVISLSTNAAPIGPVTATSPFTFGTADSILVYGWYFRT